MILSMILSKKGHWVVRGLVGIVMLVVGFTGWTPGLGPDQAISLSFKVLGGFVLVHLCISVVWDMITPANLNLVLDPGSLVQLAGALLTAPTVVVGLLAAFQHPLPPAVKVGAVSLAIGVLVGFILFGLVVAEVERPRGGATGAAAAGASGTPETGWERRNYFRSYFFNVTLWLVALGLLCITFGLVVN